MMQEQTFDDLAGVLQKERIPIEQRWYSLLSHLPLADGSLGSYRARYDLAALLGEALYAALVQGDWAPLNRVLSNDVAGFRSTFSVGELQRIVAAYREAARPCILGRVRGERLQKVFETFDRCLDSVVYQIGQAALPAQEPSKAAPPRPETQGVRPELRRLVADVEAPLAIINLAARNLASHIKVSDAEGRRHLEYISRKVVEINSLLTALLAEASLPAGAEVTSAKTAAAAEHGLDGC